MSQETIAQRLKILIPKLGLDVKGFCQRLDVGETTVRNYFSRGNNPNAEFLAKLTNTFEYVNMSWLLTGKGEPVFGDSSNTDITTATVKKNSGVVGSHGTQYNIEMPSTFDGCKQRLALLTTENEGLRSTVAALETALSAKEEILTLLRGGHNRPN